MLQIVCALSNSTEVLTSPLSVSTLYFDKGKHQHGQCYQISVKLLFKTVARVLLTWKSLQKICQVNQEKLYHQQKSNLQTDSSIFRTPAPKHWAKQRELSYQGINMSVSCLLKLTGLRLYAQKTAFLFYFFF